MTQTKLEVTHSTGVLDRVLPVVGPAVLALLIGLTHLTLRPLWLDELITASRVESGLDRLLVDTWDVPVLPYYLLVYVWTFGGQLTADAWLRGLSVAWVVGSVALVAYGLRRRFGTLAAAAGGTVMAVTPSVAYYAQEGRSYSLGLFLVSLSCLALLLDPGLQRRRSRILYAVALSCSALFMQTALLVLVAHPVVIAVSAGPVRSRLIQWLKSVALAAPFILLALYFLLGHGSTVHGWLESPTAAALLKTPVLVTRWLPLAYLLIAIAMLSREGIAWLCGAAAAVLAIWTVSVLATSFWLEGSLLLLVPLVCVGVSATLSTIEVSFALAWLGFVVLITLPQTYGVLSRTENTRFSRPLAEAVVQSDTLTIKVADDSKVSVVRAALRHYAEDHDIAVLTEDQTAEGPYWLLGGEGCPGGQRRDLTPVVALTLCPSAQ